MHNIKSLHDGLLAFIIFYAFIMNGYWWIFGIIILGITAFYISSKKEVPSGIEQSDILPWTRFHIRKSNDKNSAISFLWIRIIILGRNYKNRRFLKFTINHENGHLIRHDFFILLFLICICALYLVEIAHYLLYFSYEYYSSNKEDFCDSSIAPLLCYERYIQGFLFEKSVFLCALLFTLYGNLHRREFIADDYASQISKHEALKFLTVNSLYERKPKYTTFFAAIWNKILHPSSKDRKRNVENNNKFGNVNYLYFFIWSLLCGLLINVIGNHNYWSSMVVTYFVGVPVLGDGISKFYNMNFTTGVTFLFFCAYILGAKVEKLRSRLTIGLMYLLGSIAAIHLTKFVRVDFLGLESNGIWRDERNFEPRILGARDFIHAEPGMDLPATDPVGLSSIFTPLIFDFTYFTVLIAFVCAFSIYRKNLVLLFIGSFLIMMISNNFNMLLLYSDYNHIIQMTHITEYRGFYQLMHKVLQFNPHIYFSYYYTVLITMLRFTLIFYIFKFLSQFFEKAMLSSIFDKTKPQNDIDIHYNVYKWLLVFINNFILFVGEFNSKIFPIVQVRLD